MRSEAIMRQYNKFEHSVLPSLDYNFANEKYTFFHPWYKFTRDLKDTIESDYNVNIFNIKLSITSFGYNLYIYLYDSKDYHKLPIDLFDNIKDSNVIKCVNDLILKHKVKDIVKRNINPNGIFVFDYMNSYLSHCYHKSYQLIREYLKNNYSIIKETSYWDSTLYIFVETDFALNNFGSIVNVSTLKKEILKIVKRNDKKDLFTFQHVRIRIDSFDLYARIGGQNYFRSDAMIEAKLI